MREKPAHTPFSFHSSRYNHSTHRCFYIDGECKFSFLLDSITDINTILANFFVEKDFISTKEYIDPDWNHIGLLDYFPETNEVFLTTNSNTKNYIKEEFNSKTIAKQKRKAERNALKQIETATKPEEVTVGKYKITSMKMETNGRPSENGEKIDTIIPGKIEVIEKINEKTVSKTTPRSLI